MEEERAAKEAWAKDSSGHVAVGPAERCRGARAVWELGLVWGRIRENKGNGVVEISPQTTFSSAASIPAEGMLP